MTAYVTRPDLSVLMMSDEQLRSIYGNLLGEEVMIVDQQPYVEPEAFVAKVDKPLLEKLVIQDEGFLHAEDY